jgi:hypothetical protein
MAKKKMVSSPLLMRSRTLPKSGLGSADQCAE